MKIEDIPKKYITPMMDKHSSGNKWLMLDPKVLKLIKDFERCELVAYHGAADPENIWTIGWGHTHGVERNDAISQELADFMFKWEVSAFAAEVWDMMNQPGIHTNPGQFGAFVSLGYNIGLKALEGSTAMKLHVSEAFVDVPAAMLMWRNSNGVPRRGLLRRRLAEASLYVSRQFVF